MRDVIRVERHPGTTEDTTEPIHHEVAVDGPTIDGDSLAALGRVADEVLPSIVARLAVSGLGELEIRHRDWRIRVRRGIPGVEAPIAASGTTSEPAPSDAANPAAAPTRSTSIATSPAVGYFAPRPELAVGTRTGQGDVLGWIDVLGVRQEVVSPLDGLVGKLLVGPGDPVEYGQELVQLVPGGSKAETSTTDGADA